MSQGRAFHQVILRPISSEDVYKRQQLPSGLADEIVAKARS